MRPFVIVFTLVLIGCVPEPVRWDPDLVRTDGILADSMRLTWAVDSTGTDMEPVIVPAWTPPSWPSEGGLCIGSLRASQASTGEVYSSWFTARADSSVVLRVARSDDGGRSWLVPVTADSMDVGRTGCDRPAPFIAVDPVNGYVHLAYHLVAVEGAGVFFAHSMERGELFHEPVPMVYGDRPSAASVASRGDTVVVVFEDPNSRVPRLGLALSRTQGHIFEARVPASDDSGEARTPRVAVRGDRIAIVWTASQRGGVAPRIVVRKGTLIW